MRPKTYLEQTSDGGTLNYSGCYRGDCRGCMATRSSTAGHIAPVIRVYDSAGNVVETDEHAGDFKEW